MHLGKKKLFTQWVCLYRLHLLLQCGFKIKIMIYLLLLILSHFVVGLLCAFYFLYQVHLENIEYGLDEKIWSEENQKVFTRIILFGYASFIIIIVARSIYDDYSDYD